MTIPLWVWALTVGVLIAILVFDLVVIGRRPHEPTLRECAIAIAVYVGLAIAFGIGVWVLAGPTHGKEFFGGWLTEYSLSVDNLFVFVILMARFGVPRALQQTALMVGIILALVLRGVFIAVGAAAISAFSWVFYIFGAFLVYTAVQLARNKDDDGETRDNAVLRWLLRRLPLSEDYAGVHLSTVRDGRRLATPLLVVIVALGTTDLLFALDSIPAIYGLTKAPYLVFAANVFALMGLRQLYFLIGGLLSRLVYLSIGLSVILGFIGVKLICEALTGSGVSWAPHIGIEVSLGVIVGVLLVTTLASMAKTRRDPSAIRAMPGSPTGSRDDG